jgi:hypothetical protein
MVVFAISFGCRYAVENVEGGGKETDYADCEAEGFHGGIAFQ